MWTPTALIVLILALSVSLAYVIAILGLVAHGKSLSEAGAEVMIAVVGAMIAIISGYVGRYHEGKFDHGRETRPGDPPDPKPDQTTQPDVSGSGGRGGEPRQDEPSP